MASQWVGVGKMHHHIHHGMEDHQYVTGLAMALHILIQDAPLDEEIGGGKGWSMLLLFTLTPDTGLWDPGRSFRVYGLLITWVLMEQSRASIRWVTPLSRPPYTLPVGQSGGNGPWRPVLPHVWQCTVRAGVNAWLFIIVCPFGSGV